MEVYVQCVCVRVYMQNKIHLLTNMKMSFMSQWNIYIYIILFNAIK